MKCGRYIYCENCGSIMEQGEQVIAFLQLQLQSKRMSFSRKEDWCPKCCEGKIREERKYILNGSY